MTATRLAFLVAGLAMGAWAPLVPFAKARAGLDEGALGLLLLCVGAGSMCAMPLAGAAAGRFGCRAVIIAGSALISVSILSLGSAASVTVLGPGLFAFGAGVGTVDCTMNVQAIIVERALGRPMMSGFHGLFSVGGIAGAAGMSVLLAAGMAPGQAVVVAGLVLAGLVAAASPGLLRGAAGAAGPGFALPLLVREFRPVLLIGALCFAAFLAEGATLDWSAVFLTEARGAPVEYGGLGFAAFSLTMTAGRLAGDEVVRRLGRVRILRLGGVLAAAGLAIATLAPWWQVGIAGYALLGAGSANIVPVLFTALGRQTLVPEHLAVPAVTTLGYAGILLGPAAIGLVAGASSLAAALLCVSGLMLCIAAAARRV